MVNWFVYVEADVSGYAWFMEKKDQNVVFKLNIGLLCIAVGTGFGNGQGSCYSISLFWFWIQLAGEDES